MIKNALPNRKISEQESRTISVIRIAAMIMIVLCHYTQAIGYSALGQLFNVGVPIFFMISGFLYGQKTIKKDGIIQWYKKQIIKLVVPIYIYYIITTIILSIMHELGTISVTKVILQLLNLQGFCSAGIGNVEAGPLWFISYILLCYLITPILQRLRDRVAIRFIVFFIVGLYVTESIVIMLIKPFGFITNVTGVITYIMFYYIGAYWSKKINVKWYVILTVLMIASTALRLAFKNYADSFGGIYELLYNRVIVNYTHLALASWIFFSLYGLCRVFDKIVEKIKPITDCFDKYSYYVYIVHAFFLFGKIGTILEETSNNVLMWTLLFLILTVIYSFTIKCISSIVFKKIKS